MWNRILQLRPQRRLVGELRRYFMSASLQCNDVWGNRLKSPILKKVDIEDLYYELDNRFSQAGRVSAIDIDIFVNAVKNEEHLDEMEDLVHRLRLTSESSNMLESTPHAFIRNFLEFGDPLELLRILNDRLNYGIFPDKFCSLLLFDYFIKKDNYCAAAKVATLHMLQEDFTDDLIKYMSLFSCHKYLLNPTVWEEKEEPVQDQNSEGEEERVRVKFIRNPFFDGHFDLKDPDQLIGKTLLMICEDLNQDFTPNYQIIGNILRRDATTTEFLNGLVKNEIPVSPDIINLALKIVERLKTSSEESEAQGHTDFEAISTGLNLLKEKNNNSSKDILKLLEERINNLVNSKEKLLVEQQIETYDNWENKRENALRNELEKLKKKSILQEIQEKKEELKRKEDELFFFEKENELDLKIENKKVRYPPKWLGKKKKKRSTQDDYVPPEIVKQRG